MNCEATVKANFENGKGVGRLRSSQGHFKVDVGKARVSTWGVEFETRGTDSVKTKTLMSFGTGFFLRQHVFAVGEFFVCACASATCDLSVDT